MSIIGIESNHHVSYSSISSKKTESPSFVNCPSLYGLHKKVP